MKTRVDAILQRTAVVLIAFFCFSLTMSAEEAPATGVRSDSLTALTPAAPLPVLKATVPLAPEPPHRFWDKQNAILFGVVAATSAADFVVTRQNLQSGGKELNPVTRVLSGSTAGLAANFAGETAGVIGLSYFFHKTGHHKLERITSMLNATVSSVAISYDLTHR